MQYVVVIEKADANYSAYIPDLPGCVAVGETLEEVKEMIAEAIEFHIEGMIEYGLPIPQPTSIAHEVEVVNYSKT
ncbi:type II toxin-antitoxin system HicB family antitoxin [Nostoc sp. WHI]|uniref:type II toxin-antitoxin system HicB family antitoxin n=1 Tax=Nostoc sp. WHI TaxID=2650611 RepID=UPI0018C505B9|nr:type II toxin-antitoxin system HicB family antitoxin [Nostoc sp. WHI]MBG1271715.1 type II toxin-antitoxin system HicB family antitoxin [Nostoc sp. WHI]